MICTSNITKHVPQWTKEKITSHDVEELYRFRFQGPTDIQTSGGSRISQTRGRQPPSWGCKPIFWLFCSKMKEFGSRGGRASLAPPLDPPIQTHYQTWIKSLLKSNGYLAVQSSRRGQNLHCILNHKITQTFVKKVQVSALTYNRARSLWYSLVQNINKHEEGELCVLWNYLNWFLGGL